MSALRTPAPGGYDQSLLAAAPEATKAAKQEGYNVDLLDAGRQRSTPPTRRDIEAAHPKETYGSSSAVNSQNVPFWRTRRGIIGLAVLAIVIVGAVVGGAVGGSVSHHNNKNATLPTSAPKLPLPGQTSSTSSSSSASATPGQQTGAVTTTVAGQQVQSSSSPGPNADSAKSTPAADGPISLPTVSQGSQGP